MRIKYCSSKFLSINDILIDKNETEWWKFSASQDIILSNPLYILVISKTRLKKTEIKGIELDH